MEILSHFLSPPYLNPSSSLTKHLPVSTAASPLPSSCFHHFITAQRQTTQPWKRSSISTKTLSASSSSSVASTAAASTDPPPPLPKKKVLIPIGYGTEEMEAVIMIDVLRRAGAEVVVASVEPQLEIEASSGTKLVADVPISDCSDEIFDLVALPGGMPGSARLRDCKILKEITSRQAEENRLYGAICAAPAIALLPWGLLRRKRTTCHPAFIDKLPTFWAVKSNNQVSGELTTSRGPGTTFEFALSLVEQLYGDSIAKKIKELLLVPASGSPRKEEYNRSEWTVRHTPHVLIPIANGSEEIEIVTLIDVLRRAKMNVEVASVEKSMQILASNGTKIVADKSIASAVEMMYDMVILPGGARATERLHKSRILKKLLKKQESAGRIYGAVDSSSSVLHKQGLLKDKKATTQPLFTSKLSNQAVDGSVVIDGNVITCRGLATATDFALAIVYKLFGHSRARSVAEGLVFEYPRN